MRVEVFSTEYYMTEMYVEEGEGRPRVNDQDYRDLQYEVHEAGVDEQGIVMQMDEIYFEVEPSRNTPTHVLELPQEALDNTRIRNPPARRRVMLPRPQFYRFLREPNIARNEVL